MADSPMRTTMKTTTTPTALRIPLVVLLAVVAWASPVTAAETADDLLQPRVSRETWGLVLRAADIDPETRLIAEMVYDSYVSDLWMLIEEADATAEDAGLARLRDADAGRLRIPFSELRTLRASVLASYAPFLRRLHEMNEAVFEDLATLLDDSARARIVPEVRARRRMMHLRSLEVLQNASDYAGDGLDLIALATEARSAGGPLAGVRPGAIDQALEGWAQGLDALLRFDGADRMVARLQWRVAGLLDDPDAERDAAAELMAHWRNQHELTWSAAMMIRDLVLADRGETVAAEWRTMVAAATFPWLYRDRRPDRQITWLRKHDLPEATAEAVAAIERRYHRRLDEIAAPLVERLVRARVEYGWPLQPRSELSELPVRGLRDLYQDLLRGTGELATLDAEISAELETAAGPSLGARMRRTVR